MRKLSISFTLLAIMAFTTAGVAPSSKQVKCDSKSLKKAGISELRPYYYSSSITTNVKYKDSAYTKEIVVPLFKGEEYRMVFNGKALPAGVEINIYDKDKSHTSRKPIYSTTSSSSKTIIYEPNKAKKQYITYNIPAGKGIKDACMVLVLGYQLTFIK